MFGPLSGWTLSLVGDNGLSYCKSPVHRVGSRLLDEPPMIRSHLPRRGSLPLGPLRPREGDRGRERDFGDRASDEVRSWLGDDDAERRRREDERRGGGGYGRDYSSGFRGSSGDYRRSDYGRGTYGGDDNRSYGSRLNRLFAVTAHSQTTLSLISPRPSTAPTIVCPRATAPTPSGVPEKITSPG